MLTILCFCENPWLVRANPQTWNTTGNGDWFPITGVRCGSGYVILGGSSQGGVQKLDLTPVSSGGIAVRVALQPIKDMALDTVLPRVNVGVPYQRTKSYWFISIFPTWKWFEEKKTEIFCWLAIKHINENLKILCRSGGAKISQAEGMLFLPFFLQNYISIKKSWIRRFGSAVPTVSNPPVVWIRK